MVESFFHAIVDYGDNYVQPIILEAFASILPNAYGLIDSSSPLTADRNLLQFRQYESIDFETCFRNPKSLCNAYIIRKALIRKHYLSNTIFEWTTKHPTSPLKAYFKPGEHFELDYAEFLDDALVEAFDLRAAFSRNGDKPPEQREWWILKPGMSERGQGIRLFSTEEELQDIFEEWEADASDDDEDENDDENEDDDAAGSYSLQANGNKDNNEQNRAQDRIITSHLRHFTAQPYIHPPLLIPEAPYVNRKFHIRTYIVASGALKVYVYNHMLALFASEPYCPPWETLHPTNDVETTSQEDAEAILQKMRNIHLTNTCVQTPSSDSTTTDAEEANTNVYLLSSLPLSAKQHATIRSQIHEATAEVFRAAVAQPTNFQPLPNAFEIYGVDFLVADLQEQRQSDDATRDESNDRDLGVQLLEVNAFPDFAQTGTGLRDVVVKGLFEEVARWIIGPFFGVSEYHEEKINGSPSGAAASSEAHERMTQVLDLDIGRR